MPSRCALYARVSTIDQHCENQLAELRTYCTSRGWTITREYVDQGVSGAKERRPALDELVRDGKRRRFNVLVCWRFDRLGRNLRHLVLLLEELQALGVAFASLNEGIDATTPAGRLQMHMLAALSEFERGRIQDASGRVWPVLEATDVAVDDRAIRSAPTVRRQLDTVALESSCRFAKSGESNSERQASTDAQRLE